MADTGPGTEEVLSPGALTFMLAEALGESLAGKGFPVSRLLRGTYHEKPLVGVDDAEPDGHVGVLTVLQEGADGDVPSGWVRLCEGNTEPRDGTGHPSSNWSLTVLFPLISHS